MVDWGKSGKRDTGGRFSYKNFLKLCGKFMVSIWPGPTCPTSPLKIQFFSQLSVDGNTTRSCKGPHPPTTHPSLQPVAEYIRVQLAQNTRNTASTTSNNTPPPIRMRPGTAPVGARKKVNRNQPFGEVFQIKSINTTNAGVVGRRPGTTGTMKRKRKRAKTQQPLHGHQDLHRLDPTLSTPTPSSSVGLACPGQGVWGGSPPH